MQHGKVERTVHSGKGTGELSFFFGMRHLGRRVDLEKSDTADA